MGQASPQEEIEAYLKEGAVLIDVRSKGEFKGGSVDGAINIPSNMIKNSVSLPEDKNKKIILFCASGARSGSAVGVLKEVGYNYVLNGGSVGSMKQMMSAL